jgi:hypothetical protein
MKSFWAKAKLRSVLADAKATGKTLDGAVLRLYRNNIIITEDITIDSFDEANFDGYAVSAAIVWGTALNEDDGVMLPGDAKEYTATGDTTENTVFGWYVTTAGETPALIYAESLDEPVGVAVAGDGLVVVPMVRLLNFRDVA